MNTNTTNAPGLVIRFFANGYFLCDGKPPAGHEDDEEIYIGTTIRWFDTWEAADDMRKVIDRAYATDSLNPT